MDTLVSIELWRLLLIGVMLSIVQAALAIAIGVRLGGRPRDQVQQSVDPDTAYFLISRLEQMAASLRDDVDSYGAEVASEAIDLQGSARGADHPLSNIVLSVVGKIMDANERLERKLASAQSNLEQHAQLLRAHIANAHTDPLTGLPNRRAFEHHLAQRVDDCKRNGSPLALMMIDVDHFKHCNDNFGHQAGDAVLKMVAELTADGMREADFVARLGGEEFAVLLPGVSAAAAWRPAERMREQIARTACVVDGAPIYVTVSQGIANLAADESIASFVNRADAALYVAKRDGRNCTRLEAGPPARATPVRTASRASNAPAADDEWDQIRDGVRARYAEITEGRDPS